MTEPNTGEKRMLQQTYSKEEAASKWARTTGSLSQQAAPVHHSGCKKSSLSKSPHGCCDTHEAKSTPMIDTGFTAVSCGNKVISQTNGKEEDRNASLQGTVLKISMRLVFSVGKDVIAFIRDTLVLINFVPTSILIPLIRLFRSLILQETIFCVK